MTDASKGAAEPRRFRGTIQKTAQSTTGRHNPVTLSQTIARFSKPSAITDSVGVVGGRRVTSSDRGFAASLQFRGIRWSITASFA